MELPKCHRMDDAGPPHLRLVDVDANARLFDAVLETMTGVPKPTRVPRPLLLERPNLAVWWRW